MASQYSHLTEDEKHQFFQLMVRFSEERREEVLEQIFDIYDRDHNKVISADELRVTISDLTDLTEVDDIVQKIMNAADYNHDGLITLNEFIDAMKHLVPKASP
mmetsp:Transcript_7747/g.14709  ORF Transcript_7747/g.14709 Transcript_7747/m.14709 type:complete len:103 (+) Transcript_7747:4245-4553(+)